MGCGASAAKPRVIDTASREMEASGDGAPGGRFRGVKVSYFLGEFRTTDFEDILAEKPQAKVYDIEERIRKLTEDVPCPKDCAESCHGSALVDWLTDEHAGRATIMLSYGWGYEVRKIVDALEAYCRRHNLDVAEVIVWICCLCVNQHRVQNARNRGQDVPFEAFRREFGERVTGIGRVVALLSPWHNPLYIQRVWCIFELFEATASADVDLELVVPSSDAHDLQEQLATGSMTELWQTLASLNIKNAEASVQSDRDHIFRLIQSGPGFAKVNGEVATRLGDWFAVTCSALVKQQEATLGPTHSKTLTSISNLGLLLEAQGKLGEAEPLYRRALEGMEATLGPTHNRTLTSINNLGTLLQAQGKLGEAEPLHRRALEGKEATLGPTHSSTLTSINNLAALLKTQGKLGEAEPLYRRALEGMEATLGPTHSDTLTSINNLGSLLKAQGKLGEAEPLCRLALEGKEATLGPTHNSTLTSISSLGLLLQAQGKLGEAEPLLRRALEGREATLGPTHNRTLTSINNLAELFQAQGKLGEAEPLLRRALEGREATLGPTHGDTLTSINNLAELLQEQGKLDEAKALTCRTQAAARAS